MLHLLAFHTIFASGVTIQIGNNAWTLSSDFLIYLVVAAIVGLVAEFVVGWRLPFGIIGAVIAGLIGVWLMTKVIIISGFNDINIGDVPLIRALIGAIILVALWHLLTYRGWHRRERRRYYRRY
jgi:uncharacterized membrane protein YeaQ/YmgE (transglycosylase-associated protein family)